MKLTRTNYGRFSIKYKGPMTWNTLPDVLKNIKSQHMFRKEFKTFMLHQNIDYQIKSISLSIITETSLNLCDVLHHVVGQNLPLSSTPIKPVEQMQRSS